MSDSEPRSIFCASCGKPTTLDAKFCKNCGAQANGGQQTAPSDNSAASIIAPRKEPLTGSAPVPDANGPKMAGGTRPARAGKWVLIGGVGLVGLLVLLVAAGLLIDKARWKAPNVQTVSTENAAPPSASTATSNTSTPSTSEDDKYVATVRGGVLSAPYNTTTIGKALEATFTEPRWRSFETAKGQKIVEFTGRLKPEMYKKEYLDHLDFCASQPPSSASCESEYKDEIGISTVKLQFDLTADGSSFSVGHIDEKPWFFTSLFNHGSGQINPEEILAYIYK